MVKQCCSTDGVEAQYIKDEILPHFFKHFWNHRMALDRRNYRQLVDTTVEIANRVGASEIINRLVDDLKDENEQYRKMVMESIEKILGGLGAADIDSRLEEQLIDGILYAFQEQTTEVSRGEFLLDDITERTTFFIFFPGCRHAERLRHHRECAGQASQAVSAADLRNNPLEAQQQVCKGRTRMSLVANVIKL